MRKKARTLEKLLFALAIGLLFGSLWMGNPWAVERPMVQTGAAGAQR